MNGTLDMDRREWRKRGATRVLDLRDPLTKMNRMRGANVLSFVEGEVPC